MKVIKGDLIDLAIRGQFDLIAHGCNCMCTMGAGIARSIRSSFPEAYQADQATSKGDRSKLGTCTHALCSTDTGSLVVVNAYTQYHWRGRGVLVDYEAVSSCMRWIAAEFPQCRIGLPMIGAGLARGDWSRIESILATEFSGLDATVVEYSGGV